MQYYTACSLGCEGSRSVFADIAKFFDFPDRRFEVNGRPVRVGKHLYDNSRIAARQPHQLVIQDPVFFLENSHVNPGCFEEHDI